MRFLETEALGIELDDAVINLPHGVDSIETIKWFVLAGAACVCISLCVVSAKYFANDDYRRGQMTLLAAIVAGMAPQLARLFLY